MRKLVIACLAAGMMGCVSLPKLNVGVGMSAVLPEESTLENTYMLDGFVRVDVATVQAELSVGWKTYDYTEEGTLDEGELEQIPVAATVRWVTGPAMARVIVGGGLVWNISDISEIASITGTEDAVGYRAILGLDIKVIQDFRVSIEGIYDFTEIDLGGGGTLDSSGITARLAIAYNF